MKFRSSPWWLAVGTAAALTALALALGGHTLGAARTEASPPPITATAQVAGVDSVQVLYVGFTPPVGVAKELVAAIDRAQKEVLVQAYGFTHNAIAQAVIRAHQRGLRVAVLLDEKSDHTNRYVIDLFRGASVDMRLDGKHAIAHNKVILIDSDIVVTGSFNFTNSAETRNAENLLILRGAKLATAYRDNWQQHWQHSKPGF